MPQKLSKGTPDINVLSQAMSRADSTVPNDFSALKFDPQGLNDLRQMLGTVGSHPGAYTQHKSRFDAADIAWFSSGCATDGKHSIPTDQFHPALTRMYKLKFSEEVLRSLREKTEKVVFDTVSSRLSGFLFHNDPPSRPLFWTAHSEDQL